MTQQRRTPSVLNSHFNCQKFRGSSRELKTVLVMSSKTKLHHTLSLSSNPNTSRA